MTYAGQQKSKLRRKTSAPNGTTIMIGVSQIYKLSWLSVLALVTSAGTTIASAWEGYFKNKEMWMQKTVTLNQLYELDSDIRYEKVRSGNQVPRDKVDEFYVRYENIMSDAAKSEDKCPLDFVQTEVKEQIKSFDRSRNYYRDGYFWVTLALASLSALTTVLIGVSQIYKLSWLSVLALVTSAGTTIASAWEGYFKNKEMWMQKTVTLNQLYELDSDIRYEKVRSGNQVPRDKVDEFYVRYENILKAANMAWLGVRSAQEGAVKPEAQEGAVKPKP